MKKYLSIGLFVLFLSLPVFASAKTILSARTYGGFCPPPGCPEKIVKLNLDFFGWGQVQQIRLDSYGKITQKTTLAWLPPEVMNKIMDTIEKIEVSELYDTEKDKPMIADIPTTDYKIFNSSNDELIIGRQTMGHLWLQRNYMGHFLTKLINSLSSLSSISTY